MLSQIFKPFQTKTILYRSNKLCYVTVQNLMLVPVHVPKVRAVLEGRAGPPRWRPSPSLCPPLQVNLLHLIIYYHVIGRKFNKLLRAEENQYLLNAVYM